MTNRNCLGLGFAPLIMRLAVAAVFLWAGSSKLFVTDVFPPEQAALLANIGIVDAQDAIGAEPEFIPNEQAEPQEPMQRPVEDPVEELEEQLDGPDETPIVDPPGARAQPSSMGRVLLVQNEPEERYAYTAADFPEGVEARRLNGIALLLHSKAYPAEGAPLWPEALASDQMLPIMAWALAVTEFAGAVFLILGLMTRFWAMGLAIVMGVALALTSIGPAVVSGDAFLGFLPDPHFQDPHAWTAAWQQLLFQLTTGALALSLVFTGAGWLSIDGRVVTRKPAKTADHS